MRGARFQDSSDEEICEAFTAWSWPGNAEAVAAELLRGWLDVCRLRPHLGQQLVFHPLDALAQCDVESPAQIQAFAAEQLSPDDNRFLFQAPWTDLLETELPRALARVERTLTEIDRDAVLPYLRIDPERVRHVSYVDKIDPADLDRAVLFIFAENRAPFPERLSELTETVASMDTEGRIDLIVTDVWDPPDWFPADAHVVWIRSGTILAHVSIHDATLETVSRRRPACSSAPHPKPAHHLRPSSMRDKYFYLEFSIGSATRFETFARMFHALKAEKDRIIASWDSDRPEDAYDPDAEPAWTDFLDAETQEWFADVFDYEGDEGKTYHALWNLTAPEFRTHSMFYPPGNWDLESVIGSLFDGEYAFMDLVKESDGRAVLYYDPWAHPFGGSDSMVAWIESFGHTVTFDSWHQGPHRRQTSTWDYGLAKVLVAAGKGFKPT